MQGEVKINHIAQVTALELHLDIGRDVTGVIAKVRGEVLFIGLSPEQHRTRH